MVTDISIDLETLGRRPGCKILSIGAVVFTREGLGKEFYLPLTTHDQEGLHEDPETVRWWQRQTPEARKVFDDPAKKHFVAGLCEFDAWVREQGFKRSILIWGNGADFDNAILQVAFDVAGVALPWEYWNNRCYRTLKNLPGAPKLAKREGTYHNALDDAKTQALHAIEIRNTLSLW